MSLFRLNSEPRAVNDIVITRPMDATSTAIIEFTTFADEQCVQMAAELGVNDLKVAELLAKTTCLQKIFTDLEN